MRTRSSDAMLLRPAMAGVRPGVNHKWSKMPSPAKVSPPMLQVAFFNYDPPI